jgi:hypothetical protein
VSTISPTKKRTVLVAELEKRCRTAGAHNGDLYHTIKMFGDVHHTVKIENLSSLFIWIISYQPAVIFT